MPTNISPPPTPPSRDERRFEPIYSPCEWIERYRPGGYHPVHLGDTFSDRRYKVLRKLGEGSFSTVWWAHDLKEAKYVVLKILISDPAYSTEETQILHHIFQASPTQASRHVTKFLDSFDHEGPNGLHKCLVFEAMGPNVNRMVRELPEFKPRTSDMRIRYPPHMAKSILKQSLQALAFLHGNGIAHGDFQPGNILFALDNIDSKTEESLRQEESVEADSISPPVTRRDGKQDRWAPRYLCISQPLTAFTNHSKDIRAKLSDMGGAYYFTRPPIKPLIPVGLRAPELILTGEINNIFDIWSFGCLLFEVVTGMRLFLPWAGLYGSQTKQDDVHLLEFSTMLGPLPDELYKHWKTSSLYFTPQRELLNPESGDGTGGGELVEIVVIL